MIDSKKLIAMVKKYEKLIYDTADYIWAHPETGPKIAIPETAKVESYVRGASIDAITMDQDAVVYNDDGTITLKFSK